MKPKRRLAASALKTSAHLAQQALIATKFCTLMKM